MDCQAILSDMVTHMKTTIDIADAILDDARALAAARHQTLKNLVEEGLRLVLERQGQRQPQSWQPQVFDGDGFAPGVDATSWQRQWRDDEDAHLRQSPS